MTLPVRTPSGLLALALLLLLATVLGCGGGGSTVTTAEIPAGVGAGEPWLDSWMYRIVEDPARLVPFEQENEIGAGWLSLYHNDLASAGSIFDRACVPSAAALIDQAAGGYPCVGLARVRIELAQTFLGASEVDRIARTQFYMHRAERPEEVLRSGHEAYFHGLLMLQAGLTDAGRTTLESYRQKPGADPLLAALAARIGSGWGSDALVDRIWGSRAEDVPADVVGLELPDAPRTAAYRARLRVMEAVARGDAPAALSALQSARGVEADLLEELEQATETGESLKVVLYHFDSAFLRSTGRLHALDAVRATGGAPDLALLRLIAEQLLGRAGATDVVAPSVVDGLALVVFGAELAPDDLLTQTRPGSRPASLVRLGAIEHGLLSSPQDKVDDLDAFVRLSNSLRDRMAAKIRAVGPEGGNIDSGMGLSERFLGRILFDGARDLQEGLAVRLELVAGADMDRGGVAARSLLELALDKNPSPPSPTLRKGRVSFRNDPPLLMELARANLDTKRPYYANEYVRPLTEVYPEFTPVREALTALDSAWNPVRAGAVR